jgi:hypothetical protein
LHLECAEHKACLDDDNDPCTSGQCHHKHCVPKPDPHAIGCNATSDSSSSSSSDSDSDSEESVQTTSPQATQDNALEEATLEPDVEEITVCGNGIVEGAEECDGSENDTILQQCNLLCQFETRWAIVVVIIVVVLFIVGLCIFFIVSFANSQRRQPIRAAQNQLSFRRLQV